MSFVLCCDWLGDLGWSLKDLTTAVNLEFHLPILHRNIILQVEAHLRIVTRGSCCKDTQRDPQGKRMFQVSETWSCTTSYRRCPFNSSWTAGACISRPVSRAVEPPTDYGGEPKRVFLRRYIFLLADRVWQEQMGQLRYVIPQKVGKCQCLFLCASLTTVIRSLSWKAPGRGLSSFTCGFVCARTRG